MAKKKKQKLTINEKLALRLVEEADDQRWRLGNVVSKFYPDGTPAEFTETPRIGEVLKDTPGLRRLSEDKQASNMFNQSAEDVTKKDSTSFELDYYCNLFRFQGDTYEQWTSCIMFKAEQNDAPIYVQDGFIDDDGAFPLFFVDGEEKEAFLILEHLKCEDGTYDSFSMRLSELHAIIAGGVAVEKDDIIYADFMVSFSQADSRYIVERIFGYNKDLIGQLFPSDETDDDKSVTDVGSQVEVVNATPSDNVSLGKKSTSLSKQDSSPSVDKDSLKKSLENSLNKKKATRSSKIANDVNETGGEAKVCDETPAPCPDSDTATEPDTTDTKAQDSE